MNKKIVRTGMILISYIALLALIVVYFKEILSGIHLFFRYATPFIIGLVIAFFLNPPYRLFMKLFKKIKCPEVLSRLLSTILVLLFAYGLITGITMIVIPQVTSNFTNFFNNFDQYLISLQGTLDSIADRFDIETFDLNLVIDFVKELGTKIQNSITEWGPQAFNYTRKVISSITSVLIGIIFSIYILNARDRILRQIHRLTFALFPEKSYKVLYHVGEVMLKTFDNYVVGQSIEAMILGTLCYLGMISFNFAYPGLISVVVAVTALVPIVGTIIGGAVGFFLYLLVDPVKAVIFLIFFTVLQQLENNLIYPKVVGSKIGLPGLWVLFAVMIGSQIGGLLGMLFGVPIFTVFYTLTRDLTVLKEKEKLKSIIPKIKNRKSSKDGKDFVIPDIILNMIEEETIEEENSENPANTEAKNSSSIQQNESEMGASMLDNSTNNTETPKNIRNNTMLEAPAMNNNTLETSEDMSPTIHPSVSAEKIEKANLLLHQYPQTPYEDIHMNQNAYELQNQMPEQPVTPNTRRTNLAPNPLSPRTMNPNMIANQNNNTDSISNNIASQNRIINNVNYAENQGINTNETYIPNPNIIPNTNAVPTSNADLRQQTTSTINSITNVNPITNSANINTINNPMENLSTPRTNENKANATQNNIEKPLGRRRIIPSKTKERPFFNGRPRNNKE